MVFLQLLQLVAILTEPDSQTKSGKEDLSWSCSVSKYIKQDTEVKEMSLDSPKQDYQSTYTYMVKYHTQKLYGQLTQTQYT